MSADCVFHSGRVFDGYRLHPVATAVAIEGDRTTAVGTDDEVRAAAGSATEVVDLAGRLIHPGFTDAHVHAVQAGVERRGCDLLAGLEEAQRVLHGFGITGWQEAIVGDYAATPNVMPAYLHAIGDRAVASALGLDQPHRRRRSHRTRGRGRPRRLLRRPLCHRPGRPAHPADRPHTCRRRIVHSR